MKAKQIPQKVRDTVRERSGGVCEVCGEERADQQHHRRPRAMGGSRDEVTNLPSNLLDVGPNCHARIESNRRAARGKGWLLKQREDPAEVPVDLTVGTVLLGEGYEPVDEETVRRYRGCDRKDTYTSLMAAENAAKAFGWSGHPSRPYPCSYCHSYHLTTKGSA